MSINFINQNADKNRGRAVIKTGIASYNNSTDVERSFFVKDFTREDQILRGYPTSFNTGTGILVNSTGGVIFNNETFGGSLVDVTIINDGAAACYIGFNNDGISVASGSELGSGVSMELSGPITKIWAVTSTGTSSLNVFGITNYNQESI